MSASTPNWATRKRPTRRLRSAAHVVSLDTWIQRVTGVPMETRSAVGVYDPESERYTLYCGSGGVVRQKREISQILNVPFESVRIVAGDIGGNFGTKNSLFPEHPLLVWAAKKVGRPVKWTCERTEAFLSDYQGRDLVSETELALDADGNVPGAARFEPQQYRRLRLVDRSLAQGRRHHERALPHSRRLFPRTSRAQQHDRRRFLIAAPGGRRRCSSSNG